MSERCDPMLLIAESNGTNAKTAPSCDKGEFQCLDERCIDARWRCDGINDCGSMEDEIDCGKKQLEFTVSVFTLSAHVCEQI